MWRMLQIEFYISGKKVVYLFLNAISRTLRGKAPQYHLLFSQFSSWLPRLLVVVQLLSHLWVFATPWTAAHQASLSFTISQSLLRFKSIKLVMLSISSFVIPLSFCLQSFPASGSFPMRWLFASGGQNIGASASPSVLPMNIQGWFPLRLTGLISLLSKGLSRAFYSTTFWKYQFFATQPSL